MKPVFGKELARVIQKKGWTLVRINDSRHIMRQNASGCVVPKLSIESFGKPRF